MKAINKVLINTLSLYLNMGVTIIVTLLGTRIILDEMGETKFGVYTLIASVVAMLAFVNAAMTAASQRYLCYTYFHRSAPAGHTFDRGYLPDSKCIDAKSRTHQFDLRCAVMHDSWSCIYSTGGAL